MITYEWVEVLPSGSAAEISDLLTAAVAYDAEAGFSTARSEAPAVPDGTFHLVVSMPPKGQRGSPHLDRLPDVAVVAYLRLDLDGGVGEVELVVRPEFRSLGVATLLLERLRDEGSGWGAVPGLREIRSWAHGAHPAAGRMSARFGGSLTDAVFKTFREVGGSRPFVAEVSSREIARVDAVGTGLAASHAGALAPADRATLARVGNALTDPIDGARVCFGADAAAPAALPACIVLVDAAEMKRGTALRLLSDALLAVQDVGARVVQLYVDPLDDEVLAASRELDFVHDQSDLRYALVLRA